MTLVFVARGQWHLRRIYPVESIMSIIIGLD
jgi:hypothetical protein